MEQEIITMNEIFVFRQQGIDPTGRAFGAFEATGIRPRFTDKLAAAGVKLPLELFQQRVLLKD
jgi:pilus assembly protein CpaF